MFSQKSRIAATSILLLASVFAASTPAQAEYTDRINSSVKRMLLEDDSLSRDRKEIALDGIENSPLPMSYAQRFCGLLAQGEDTSQASKKVFSHIKDYVDKNLVDSPKIKAEVSYSLLFIAKQSMKYAVYNDCQNL
jgi:hypothetical protein